MIPTNTHMKYLFVYKNPLRDKAKESAHDCAREAIEACQEYISNEQAEEYYHAHNVQGMSEGDFMEHCMVAFCALWNEMEANPYNPRLEYPL